MTAIRITINVDRFDSFYVRKSGKQHHADSYVAARTYADELATTVVGEVVIIDLVPLERRGNASIS